MQVPKARAFETQADIEGSDRCPENGARSLFEVVGLERLQDSLPRFVDLGQDSLCQSGSHVQGLFEAELGSGEMLDKIIHELDQSLDDRDGITQGKTCDRVDSGFRVQDILNLHPVSPLEDFQFLEESLPKSRVGKIPVAPSGDLAQV